MKTLISTLSLASVFLVAATARAQEMAPPPAEPMAGAPMSTMGGDTFGQQGQIAFDANLRGGFNLAIPSSGDSELSFLLSPSMIYFVAPNIAVGGTIVFAYAKEGDSKATTFGIGPTAAYNIALSEKMSLLPSLFFAYQNVSLTVMNRDGSGNSMAFGVSVPVLFHLAPHLFIGAGPSFSYTFVNKFEGVSGPKVTNIGVGLTIGGWI